VDNTVSKKYETLEKILCSDDKRFDLIKYRINACKLDYVKLFDLSKRNPSKKALWFLLDKIPKESFCYDTLMSFLESEIETQQDLAKALLLKHFSDRFDYKTLLSFYDGDGRGVGKIINRFVVKQLHQISVETMDYAYLLKSLEDRENYRGYSLEVLSLLRKFSIEKMNYDTMKTFLRPPVKGAVRYVWEYFFWYFVSKDDYDGLLKFSAKYRDRCFGTFYFKQLLDFLNYKNIYVLQGASFLLKKLQTKKIDLNVLLGHAADKLSYNNDNTTDVYKTYYFLLEKVLIKVDYTKLLSGNSGYDIHRPYDLSDAYNDMVVYILSKSKPKVLNYETLVHISDKNGRYYDYYQKWIDFLTMRDFPDELFSPSEVSETESLLKSFNSN